MKFLVVRNVLIGILLSFSISLTASATTVRLHIDSNIVGGFAHKSKIIELADPSDQIVVAREAALLALSAEGWDWQNFGLGGHLSYAAPPSWSAEHYFAWLEWTGGQVTQEVADMFGYSFNAEALNYNATHYQMHFHTDNWVSRYSHDLGETPNNYGVISGGMGGIWMQTAIVNWGSFWVEEVSVPAPAGATLMLSGLLAVGLVSGSRRRRVNAG